MRTITHGLAGESGKEEGGVEEVTVEEDVVEEVIAVEGVEISAALPHTCQHHLWL